MTKPHQIMINNHIRKLWLSINNADRSANQVKLVSTQLNMIHAKKFEMQF